MQALLVYHKWLRKSFDVKQAYCFADIPKDELIAVRYPKVFERWVEEYKSKTDTYEWKECFMVIRKSLYGHPAAGRRWAETRDAFILTYFNEVHDGWMWTCRRMLGKPCMFYMKRHAPHDPSKHETTILPIHTDDADMIGDSDDMFKFICDACDKKWKIKVVESDFMLGVKRELRDEDGEFSITMSMTALPASARAMYSL